jgi:hypothetical protein
MMEAGAVRLRSSQQRELALYLIYDTEYTVQSSLFGLIIRCPPSGRQGGNPDVVRLPARIRAMLLVVGYPVGGGLKS